MTSKEAQTALHVAYTKYLQAADRYYEVLGFGTSEEVARANRRVNNAIAALQRAERRMARVVQDEEAHDGPE